EPAAVVSMIRHQLEAIGSWEDFQRQPLGIDVGAVVPADVRASLDALPSSVHLLGDRVPLDYQVDRGRSTVRLWLREGQARRLQPRDLPEFDRPVTFAVRRRGEVLEADTIEAMRHLLRETERRPRRDESPPHRGGRRGAVRGMRGRGPRRRRR
ncbi:MAG: hypothetical protein ACREL5_06620, partial [Gemmatimonadales bacterium]